MADSKNDTATSSNDAIDRSRNTQQQTKLLIFAGGIAKRHSRELRERSGELIAKMQSLCADLSKTPEGESKPAKGTKPSPAPKTLRKSKRV